MGKSQYAEIVDALVGELAGCRPGARVASEHEIAARFTVSRAVAGAALRELESRLLVRRVRGSGTFVNGRIDYIISADRAPSWHQAVRAAGAEPHSAVRSATAEPLPDDLAARLDRAAGSPAHRIVRQGWINGMDTRRRVPRWRRRGRAGRGVPRSGAPPGGEGRAGPGLVPGQHGTAAVRGRGGA
jgi:DNA-binding GntR family transcriptional regulator